MADEQKQITIDGKQYSLEDLNDTAKAQLMSIQAADQKINMLKQDLAFIQTARNAYIKVLSENLPEASSEA